MAYDHGRRLTPALEVRARGDERNEATLREDFPGEDWWGKIWDFEELVQEPPPIDWLVRGIIQRGTLVMFYGDPGCYKSMLVMDMAVSIAAGATWLPPQGSGAGSGSPAGYRCRPGGVLWIDLDMGIDAIQERLYAMAQTRGPLRAPFRVAANPTHGLDLTTRKAEKQLIDLVLDSGYSLVVIDTFRRCAGDADENSSEVDRVVASLRRVVDATGATVVVIHHANKGNTSALGKIRGSTAIPAGLDLGMYVTRDESDNTVHVIPTKVRRKRPNDITAMFLYQEDADLTLTRAEFRDARRDPDDSPGMEDVVNGIRRWVERQNASGSNPGKRILTDHVRTTFAIGQARAREAIRIAEEVGAITNLKSGHRHEYIAREDFETTARADSSADG